MQKPPRFLIDSNVFVQAKNEYYAFDSFPGFWDCLIWLHQKGRILSIEKVKSELQRMDDDLKIWIKDRLPETFFAPIQQAEVIGHYATMQSWAQDLGQFTPQAINDFQDTEQADAWIVAYAKTNDCIVVTHEKYAQAAKKTIKIPNVCKEFNVDYVNTFEMLRELGVKFHWISNESHN